MQKLPDMLRQLWRNEEYAVTHLNVSGMSSIVMMAPASEIEDFRGCVTKAQMQLHLQPLAPVFRMVVTFYDQPGSPFGLETFYNIGRESDPSDLLNVELLGRQDELVFHLFKSGNHEYAYSKTINWRQKQRREIKRMLSQAQKHLGKIERSDFDRAKAVVMEENPL